VKNSLRLALLAGAVTSALGFAAAPAGATPASSTILAARPAHDHHHGRSVGGDKKPDDAKPNKVTNVTNDRHRSHDNNRTVRTSHDTNRNITDDRHTSHDINRTVRTSHDVNRTLTNDRHISHDTNFNTTYDQSRNINYNVTNDYGPHVLPDIKFDSLPIVGSFLG
jgi:hypothetical protein